MRVKVMVAAAVFFFRTFQLVVSCMVNQLEENKIEEKSPKPPE